MAEDKRSVDWRLIAIWVALLGISWVARSFIMVADESRGGPPFALSRALAIEGGSHLVVGGLLPAVYWVHRRWPLRGRPLNLLAHAVFIVPFSIVHTLGMAALRLLWFAGFMGEAFRFPITWQRIGYEFAKNIITYGMLSAGVVAFGYLLQRVPKATHPPAAGARPERFAVRKRGGSEVMVEVADIDWIEAAGNYAILHVGGDAFEIRSSLTRLEAELDPRRFVRVHKSHVVNIARVAEVVPWVSGDWRIRLQDGAELNLSRRYRQRFEGLAPVRS